jgi:hypothetical protein
MSRLSKTVWRIEDAGVSEHLINGDDRSLLIDCGRGIGDLSKTVVGHKVFPAHGPAPIKPDVFKDVQNGVRKILAGEVRGKPETTFPGSGLAIRFDGCGILYKEDRLR